MFTLYNFFLFLHVAAISLWVGGTVTLTILNARLAGREGAVGTSLMAREGQFIGQRMMGPAAAVTLITGFGMTGLGRTGFPLWVLWGIFGAIVSISLGAFFMQRVGVALGALIAEGETDSPAYAALQSRMATLAFTNILLLASIIAAMVFKPRL